MNQVAKPLSQFELSDALSSMGTKDITTKENLVDLTSTEYVVLAAIIKHTQNYPEQGFMSFPSQELIADLTRTGSRTVQRAIQKLVDDKWIFVKYDYLQGRKNYYYINAEKILSICERTREKYKRPAGIIYPTPISVMELPFQEETNGEVV